MKKIILAAAVASMLASAGASAGTTLYGDLRISGMNGDKGENNVSGMVNNASRIGVKGSYGEEGGLQGIFKIEEGVRTDTNGGSGFTNRFAFAGIKSGFGSVLAGRLSSPYKMAGLRTDPFYDTIAGPANGGSNYGLSTLTNGWLNNVLAYVSPKLGGAVKLNAVAVIDTDDNSPNTPAAKTFYNVGADLDMKGFIASLQYISEISDGVTRGVLGYHGDAFTVDYSYENFSEAGNQSYLSGTYSISKTKLAASYGAVKDFGNFGGVRNSDGTGYTFGVFQKVASNTTLNAIYSSVEYDAATGDDEEAGLVGNGGDRKVFGIGVSQKF